MTVNRSFHNSTLYRFCLDRLNLRLNSTIQNEQDVKIKYVKDVISRELFPQLSQMVPQLGQTFRKKAFSWD